VRGLEQGAAWARGEIKLRTRQIYIFDDIDVKTVREKSGLSQIQFADRYGFNPRTLQEWEQGRARPEMAVLAYLKVIEKNPESVLAALRD
jgi:putative transcriptional regulator